MTARGFYKLVHNEFEYCKNYERNHICYWRCSKSRRGYCRGKACTQQIGLKQMVKAYDVHNHLPNE